MLNRYRKSDSTPFIRKAMLDMRKMKTELDRHRYCLEQNVEWRTEQLTKRIALLESCNATLCDRLAATQKELAVLKQQPEHALPRKDSGSDGRTLKLYVMNNQTQKLMEPNVQDKLVWHATVA